MTRRQHVLFHLGDLIASLVGIIHSVVDTPPAASCSEPIAEGFKRWSDNGRVAGRRSDEVPLVESVKEGDETGDTSRWTSAVIFSRLPP